MSTLNLDIVIKAVDQFSKNVDSMFSGFEKKFERATQASQQFATGLTAAGVAVGGFATYALKQAGDAQAAQERLTLLLRNATGATDQQIGSLTKQAAALERVGVVSAGNIIIGQSQLATFDLQASSIERLTPAILDYVVAEKGAAASADDMIQMTNGLAQALNGNFGSLTRTGFVLDEVTKDLIANGTEAEKVAAIVDVLNSTYEGFNNMARGTFIGSLQVLRNNFDGLAETIGLILIPLFQPLIDAANTAMESFIDWIDSIGGAEKVMENLGNWMRENEGLIWTIAGAISGGLALAFAAATIAAGKFILAISPMLGIGAALGAAAFAAKQAWDENFLGIQDVTNNTVTVIEDLRARTETAMLGVAEALTPASEAFQDFYDENKQTIDLFQSNVLETFLESFRSMVDSLQEFLNILTVEYGETFDEIWKTISFWWEIVSGLFGEAEGDTTTTFENILETITQVFDTVVSVVTTKLDIMLTLMAVPLQAMQGLVRVAFALMRGDVEGAMDIMSKTVSRVMRKIKETFASIWDAITSAINGALDVIVTILRESGEDWAQTLADYIERFREIGGDLVQGLIDGIKGMASKAVGAVTNMASSMVAQARSIFNSQSPSRVFMSIGHDVASGLAIGIEKSSKEAVAAVQEMANKVTNEATMKLPDVQMSGVQRSFVQYDAATLVGPKSSMGQMKNNGSQVSTPVIVTGNTFTDRYSFEKLIDEVVVQKLQKSLVAS